MLRAIPLLLLLSACNFTSQLDRDFAACVVLVKADVATNCTVSTTPTKP